MERMRSERFFLHSLLYLTTHSISALSNPMSCPFFSLSIHLWRNISSRSAINSLYMDDSSTEFGVLWFMVISIYSIMRRHSHCSSSVNCRNFFPFIFSQYLIIFIAKPSLSGCSMLHFLTQIIQGVPCNFPIILDLHTL